MSKSRGRRGGKKAGPADEADDSPLSLKDQGNKLFVAGRYEEALDMFTAAIEQQEQQLIDAVEKTPSNDIPASPSSPDSSVGSQLHICYSNRSATYSMLKRYKESLHDAEHVIQLKPEWSKGYLRAGQAYEQLLDFALAKEFYSKGAERDPNDAAVKNAIDKLNDVLSELRLTEAQLSSNPNPEKDRFQIMIDWMKAGGAKFPRLYLQYYTEDYRGVHCLSAIPSDEIILYVPFHLIMTSQVAMEKGIGKAIADAKVDLRSKHSYLASFLLQEKHRGEDSYWYPYIRCLPQHYSNMPIFFNEAKLRLLKGSFTLEKIKDRIDSLKAEYDNICAAVPEFKQFTHQEFVWARLAVITRIFGLLIHGFKTDGLVPYADMLNHKKPKNAQDTDTKWTFDDGLNGFTITSLREIPRAEQVYDSYGRKCNSRFFVNYGFALDNNEDDNEALLRFSLPANDPSLSLKQRIAGNRNLMAPREFQVPATYKETSDHEKKTKEMFSYVRFLLAVDSELMLLSGGDDFKLETIEPLSCRLEIAVLRYIAKSAQDALNAFDTTLEEDDELVKRNQFEDSNVRNCVIMRRGEKQVLSWYVRLAATCCPLLEMQWKDLRRMASRFSGTGSVDHYVTTVVAPLVKAAKSI